MDESYKIQLGVDIDVSDLQSQINKAGDKVNPIPIKVEIENLDDIKRQLRNLGNNEKNTLTLNTDSLETSLKDVKSIITDIKTSIGTLDSKSGMKSLLSSINQISGALDKASDKFTELNTQLSALAKKDFGINVGLKLGGSSGNAFSNNTAYGNYVRGTVVPQLRKQADALMKAIREQYSNEFVDWQDDTFILNTLSKRKGYTPIKTPALLQKEMLDGSNLSRQMSSIREYINLIEEVGRLSGVNISGVTAGFTRTKDELIQDALDIQSGVKGAVDNTSEQFEKLRGIFGGGIDSAQLDSIVKDLNEIKNALVGLPDEQVDGLVQTFNKLSTALDKFIANIGVVKTALGSGISGANVGGEIANSFDNSMASIEASANDASGVISKLKTTLEKDLKLDRSSIDAVTKDIEELGFEVTNASVKMKNGNFDITVKGVDSLGRAVTEIRHLDSATGKISGVSREISQSFKETENAFNRLKTIAKEMGNLEVKIAGLDAKENKAEIAELTTQLDKLKAEYKELFTITEKNLSANQVNSLNQEFANTASKLDALKAKAKDTKAELARNIKLNFSKCDAEIQSLEYSLSGVADETGELRNGIDLVKQALKTMKSASTDDELIAASENYRRALKEVENQLRQNKIAEQEAINKTALKQAQDKLSFDMSNWLKENSAAAKQFGGRIKELQAQIGSCDKASLARLRAEFTNVKKEAELAGVTTKTFSDRIKAQFAKYSSYFSVASVFMYASQGLRDMFEQVKLIDSAMTELKKVTNETDAAYNNFLSNAATKSKEIGTTIDGLVSSTADFARLGYGFEDAQGLAEVANIYAVVGDEIEGVEGATESLISTMAAFKSEMNGMSNTDFAMSIIDKFNEIGNNFAISSGGIGEALERSASSLMAANNTIDESIALITAANTVVGFVPPNIVIY